jgi:RNA recognition motif-containing protein
VTKLFVGNLPTSTTLQELLIVFKKFGPVNEKLSVVKDHNYAFIHFYNRKDAQVALKEVNDSLFKDRYIRVQFSTSQGYTYSKFKSIRKILLLGFDSLFINQFNF